MVVFRKRVALLEKYKPKQERAKRTHAAILTAAAELLVEVGVESLSTNIVAKRARVSVPALYRYFPNKHAILNALSAAYMDKHTAVVQQWVDEHLGQDDLLLLVNNIGDLLARIYAATQEQVGGLEVVQAVRAVAALREVRLAAHESTSNQLATAVAEILCRPVDELMMTQARLTIASTYAVVEAALEEDSLSAESMLSEGARMLQLYWQSALCAD
ncbi:MAG: helix-turn-helix domain containing protein [Halioglobus sp.]|nr:helix-turn-helix domain containing protein [Halioglobus sp.]